MWGYDIPRRFCLSRRENLRGENTSSPSCALPPRAEPLRKQRDSFGAVSRDGCVCMEDYKQMYLTLFHATEEAANLLIQAQQKCEELYISSGEAESDQEDPKTEQ